MSGGLNRGASRAKTKVRVEGIKKAQRNSAENEGKKRPARSKQKTRKSRSLKGEPMGEGKVWGESSRTPVRRG